MERASLGFSLCSFVYIAIHFRKIGIPIVLYPALLPDSSSRLLFR